MTLREDQVPRLLRGVRTKYDDVRRTWVLLAPERVLRLDQIGHAILAETDGVRSFGAIVTILSGKFDAPRERIAGDARRFLETLIERRMAEAA